MQRPISSAEPADYLNVSSPSCVLYGGNLIRTPGRPIDHFWNLFVPVHGFRCNRFSCHGQATFESTAVLLNVGGNGTFNAKVLQSERAVGGSDSSLEI